MSYTDLELACDILVGHNITTNPENFTGHLCECDEEEYTIFVAKGNFSNPSQIGGWISIEDELPPVKKRVLVLAGGSVSIGKYTPDDKYGKWNLYLGCGSITHWMPFPKPKKKESR